MTEAISDDPALVDTNIVVYAHDPAEADRHQEAVERIAALSGTGRLVLSAQVLNEFCSVMMRGNRPAPLSPQQAAEVVRDLAIAAEVIPISAAITLRALEAMPRYGPSFWDALIWAAAVENAVTTVYTEDFRHGRVVAGVWFANLPPEESAVQSERRC